LGKEDEEEEEEEEGRRRKKLEVETEKFSSSFVLKFDLGQDGNNLLCSRRRTFAILCLTNFRKNVLLGQTCAA
jgi:nucleosome binding factor SPN SPT16 subunit